jgi:hypothetical protein
MYANNISVQYKNMSSLQASNPTLLDNTSPSLDQAQPSADITGQSGQTESKLSGLTKDTTMIILILVVMCLIVVIIFVVVSMLRNNKMKSVVLHSNMIDLSNRNLVPYKVETEKLPNITNSGQEYAYSFWLFLGNKYDQTTNHKLLLSRGNSDVAGITSSTNFSSLTNPIIFMDSVSNKLYVAISTTEAKAANVSLDEIVAGDSNYIVSYIDYIPLQRWVHVVVSIKNIYVNIYLDGDLYTVNTVNDIITNSATARPMIRGTQGEVVIGNNSSSIYGHLSLTQLFNYSLSQKEVTRIYKKGPVRSSWLSIIGLGNYGVRTPIYEIN